MTDHEEQKQYQTEYDDNRKPTHRLKDTVIPANDLETICPEARWLHFLF